jgi:hypothetical protein
MAAERMAFLQAALATAPREQIPAGAKVWRAAVGNAWTDEEVEGEIESVPSPFEPERMRPCTLQGPLRYTAFSVSVVLFSVFQAMKTAQGSIDRLFFDRMKARDVAQSFEPCRNFNSCISNSPCDLGILQFHHRHSVKIYPKLFITIRHAIATLNIGGVVQCKLPYALYSIQDSSVAATIELRRAWVGEDVTILTIVLYGVSGSEAIVEPRLHYRTFNVLTLLRTGENLIFRGLKRGAGHVEHG